jgi:thioesterase domain-containing protein/acyl carrier protein
MSDLSEKLARLDDPARACLYRELRERTGKPAAPVKELVLVYEKASGTDPGALQDTAVSQLPEQERPSRFIAANELPRTPNGKLDRRSLPGLIRIDAPAADQPAAGDAGESDVMSAAIAVFQRVLDTDSIGPDANFFEHGGHSLLAVECVLELEKVCGKRISITRFLNHPTPRGITSLLDGESSRPFEQLYRPSKQSFDFIYRVSENRSGLPVFVFSSSRLAYALKPRKSDWTIYGVQFRWRDENNQEILYRSVEDMAEQIAAEIRALCADGEFVLAGCSFAAMVTFEVARQLRDGGTEPSNTILIEPSLSPGLRTWLELDLNRFGQLKQGSNPYLRWLLANNPLRAHFWRRLAGVALRRQGAATQDTGSPAVISKSRGYEFARASALRRTYKPSNYAGPSVLLAGADTAWLVCREWQARLGDNFSVHILDTDHDGILRNPFMSEAVVPILVAEVDARTG